MVRFVLSPEGVVVPDILRRLPGRGVWVDARRSSIEKAVEKRVFARAFRAEASAPATLAEDVGELLRRRALERLAIAQKAGLVVTGFEKVRAALLAGPVAGLIAASDGAADGRGKVEALAKKAQRLHKEQYVAEVFSSAELESTLGRERVVHVALAPGRLSDLFFSDALRLRGFDGSPLQDAELPNQPDEQVFAGPLTV